MVKASFKSALEERKNKRLFLSAKSDIPPPSHSSIQFCGDEACLENEIDVLVKNISHYYLHSWYDKISPNEEFLNYLNSSINQTLVRLCTSISKVDKKKFSYILLQIYLNFFSHFVEAKKKSETFKKENFEMKHWAMKDNLTEWCYLQSLVSTLLDSFCPSECDRSLHSKYSPLLHILVVEILTANIIHPLVKVLCDPSYLNMMLLKILLSCVKTNKEMGIPIDYKCSDSIHVPEGRFVNQPVILLPNEESSDDQVFENYSKTGTRNRLSVPDESCQINENNLKFPVKKHSYGGVSDDFPSFVSSGMKSSSNINLSNHDFADSRIPEYDTCTSTNENTIKRSRSADFIRQMPQLKALNEKDYNIILQSESNKMLVTLKSDLNSSNPIEQAEEAVEVEAPTLFTDVQIVDTFQQNEAGLIIPYTLYCIQYTGIFHDTGKSSDVLHFVKQVVSIKRRFREFVALQSKLEDNPSLKAHLKGIKGPSKWLVLPFSNLDKKYIAERKIFLENYLKELCNSPAISQSSELQEFLAYGGGERMSFVRKATDASVPRIDKMLVRGVRGAIDIFRTALPNSPLDEENAPRIPFEDTVPDQRFQEHLLDYSSREPEIKEHVRNFMENSSFKFSPDDMKGSEAISKKGSLLRNTNLKITECCHCPVLNEKSFHEEESPFGNTIIELFAVALQLDKTTLGYLFSIFKILFAPCINRFFIDSLDNVSDEHVINLLHLLHNFLWPSDEQSSEQSVKLERDLIPNKINECLEVLLTEKSVIPNLKATLREKINLFLSSIQNEEANRCLLFHMFDVVIEALCSEEI
ncbi:sorting nexin-19 [Nephila pilipes]|uniref:Sorting nexin-19 n=1 Tax=Nephila pilipes TaxID=299642 RepID=A0A8X6MQ82_NEPPI|nr:sorting nexin-19 [Nephila pilipes]